MLPDFKPRSSFDVHQQCAHHVADPTLPHSNERAPTPSPSRLVAPPYFPSPLIILFAFAASSNFSS